LVSFKINVICTSDTIANIVDFANVFIRRKFFIIAAILLNKMRQGDQQVFMLVFPYRFQPNISLVLRMASQVDT